jgi:hypothetical protein
MIVQKNIPVKMQAHISKANYWSRQRDCFFKRTGRCRTLHIALDLPSNPTLIYSSKRTPALLPRDFFYGFHNLMNEHGVKTRCSYSFTISPSVKRKVFLKNFYPFLVCFWMVEFLPLFKRTLFLLLLLQNKNCLRILNGCIYF